MFCPIFLQGGSCKICGGITHLARDCPNKGSAAARGPGNTCKFKIELS